MTRKICKWLNHSDMSGIQIRDNGNIYPCPVRWINMVTDKEKYSDYNALSLEDLQGLREKFLEEINCGEHTECQSCNLLREVEDDCAKIGPIKHLIYHPHTLCSLNCRYCFYTDEQRSTPIDPKYKNLRATIEHFYNIGFLDKEQFALDLGGGEPLLLDNIDETLDFMSKTWKQSTFYMLSNSTVVEKVNKLIETVKKGYSNVNKILITSVDCGTPDTYKDIRRKDYFYNVTENLYNYAINGTFDEIFLKYILLDDKTNSDDENVFGFLRLCKLISDNQEKILRISIDVDWLKRKHDNANIPEDLLKVAGKMYYIITEVMQVKYIFMSDYLSENTKQGAQAVKKLKEYAIEYKNSEKSFREQYELNNLRKNNLTDRLNKLEKQLTSNRENFNREICCLHSENRDLKCALDNINQENRNLKCSLKHLESDNQQLIQKIDKYFARPTMLQQIFSLKNEGKHKVLRILGIKVKFKKK